MLYAASRRRLYHADASRRAGQALAPPRCGTRTAAPSVVRTRRPRTSAGKKCQRTRTSAHGVGESHVDRGAVTFDRGDVDGAPFVSTMKKTEKPCLHHPGQELVRIDGPSDCRPPPRRPSRRSRRCTRRNPTRYRSRVPTSADERFRSAQRRIAQRIAPTARPPNGGKEGAGTGGEDTSVQREGEVDRADSWRKRARPREVRCGFPTAVTMVCSSQREREVLNLSDRAWRARENGPAWRV